MSQGKKTLETYPLVVDGDMSGDITSSSFAIKTLDNIAIELAFAGTTPTGTFFIQGSVSGDNWNNLVTDPATISAAGDGSHLVLLPNFPPPYIRVFYDFTSGTGDLQVYISGKAN